MSHTVQINMISDSHIEIKGQEIYVHDIKSIYVDNKGHIIDVWYKCHDEVEYDQMCCLQCGYIAKIDEPYETERDGMDEDFPICPNCEGFNIGGYSSFAKWGILSPDHKQYMKIKTDET